MNLVLRIPLIGAVIAVLFCLALFIIDVLNIGNQGLRAIIEALALIIIGISFMSLCFTVCRGQYRFHWRMMTGSTFCLWGLESIMPHGLTKLLLRDVVVFLFVLGLVLIILERSQIAFKK